MLIRCFSLFFIIFIINYWGEVVLILSLFFILFFFQRFDYREFNILFRINIDSLRIRLILLRIWILVISYIARIKVKNKRNNYNLFNIVIIFILLFLFLSFIFNDFLLFYLRFESCLIPIFLLVLGWGYQVERFQAGVYILLYTLFGSLPLFFIIIEIINERGRLIIRFIDYLLFERFLFYVRLVRAFLIKFPIYGVHLWLPKAHVEAPVAGSIILAGVLLKLGGYGLIRIISILKGSWLFIRGVVVVRLWGAFVIRLNCLRQRDIKSLVAYSSVVHIGGCIIGLFIFLNTGQKGCVYIIIAHGLCSSGLFFIVNRLYERVRRRSLLIRKGLINILPGFRLGWFLLLAANIAAPPTINLIGELDLIISIVGWERGIILILSLLGFFRASYSLYLFSIRQHGVYLFRKRIIFPIKLIEYLNIYLHWVPLNLLILRVFYIYYFKDLKYQKVNNHK